MRIFGLIPALAAFTTAVAGATVPVDSHSGFEDAQLPLSVVPLNTITHTGVIEVLGPNDKLLGYISKNLLDKALSCYDPSVKNATIVTFTTDQTSTGLSTKLDLTPTNQNPSYPFLGLIQGFDNVDSNLGPKSWQFLTIGGISAPGTKPGAPPSKIGNSFNDVYAGANRTAESAVWTYDAASGALTPQWINTDGSSPHEEFFAQDIILHVGGSKDAFHAKYPDDPVTTIKFKFVPT